MSLKDRCMSNLSNIRVLAIGAHPDDLEIMGVALWQNMHNGPIHTPSRNIMRGLPLFYMFLQTKYQEVDKYLSEIVDDPEMSKMR